MRGAKINLLILVSFITVSVASACGPRDTHAETLPAELVVIGHVTVPQYNEQHDEEPVWVTQSYMCLQVESCTTVACDSCLDPGEYKLRHNGRKQFLEGERVALVLSRRQDTDQYQILFRFMLSDQDQDGVEEVYTWSRADLVRNPRPTPENYYWAENLQWNLAANEEPPTNITWEDVLFKAFRDTPANALEFEGLPREAHDCLDSLTKWVFNRNIELGY